MSTLNVAIPVAWVVFWVYWLISAFAAKRGSRTTLTRFPGLGILVLAFVLLRIFKANSLTVHTPVLQVIGVVLFVSGLAFAVWARIHLGRNWGMPMTQKDEPELVTSGPYHLVRHPIYSGILLAMLGTAVATHVYWFIVFAVMGVYFIYSATVEEKIMMDAFPSTYPGYKAETKMLIPFVL